MDNLSLIGKLTPNTKIYRIFSKDYFFQLFEDRENTLVLPKKWDDPFENIFLRSKAQSISDGELVSFGFRDKIYGQCWTSEAVSDAMWQIYSRDEDGIRVRTTVGKLIHSLRILHGDWANLSCYIGRVRYLTDKELREFGKTVFKDYISGRRVAESLLVKRRAYKFENEVRLIFFDHTDKHGSEGIYKYSFDPICVIDQVMIDGRMSVDEFSRLKKEVVARTGLPHRRVQRSLLYSEPKSFVVYVPY